MDDRKPWWYSLRYIPVKLHIVIAFGVGGLFGFVAWLFEGGEEWGTAAHVCSWVGTLIGAVLGVWLQVLKGMARKLAEQSDGDRLPSNSIPTQEG